MDKINILYACNSSYFDYCTLSVLSLIKHYQGPIIINVMTMDCTYIKPHYTVVTDEQISALRKIVMDVNAESDVRLLDVTDLFREHLMGRNANTNFTPYTLARLLIDKVDFDADKLIYLDGDTMLLRSIEELYNIDISGYEFAAALDCVGKHWIARDYFNAGVLMFNLKLVKKNGLMEKCRAMVNNKFMFMPDQSALYRSKTANLILPPKFNEQRKIKPDTVIKHFNKLIKYLPVFHTVKINMLDKEDVHKKTKIYEFDDIYEQFEKIKNLDENA